jgi:ParB/RepB/Spo0J family partition protein
MSLSDDYVRLPLASVIVDREDRQRKTINVSDLLDSIRARGVMNPIIVTPEGRLVAGERRLEASKQLGLLDIPVRFTNEIPPAELQIIELEENLRRSDLPWRDYVRAIAKLHQHYKDNNPDWTQVATAKALNLGEELISRTLRVYKNLDDPRIAGSPNLASAYQYMMKLDQRLFGDAISEIIEAGMTIGADADAGLVEGLEPDVDLAASPLPGETQTPHAAKIPGGISTSGGVPPPAALRAVPLPSDIITTSFLTWAPSYRGKPFNLVHCDFPYGIGLFDGSAGSGDHRSDRSGHQDNTDHYKDTPELYISLITALCENLDQVMAQSAHLIFWFSMSLYDDTLEIFRKLAPDLIFNPIPLIWLKSDNKGVVSDFRRGPRNIYETAFLATRGDRFILKVKGNAYAAPSDKALHPSAKPEPMLRHFFEMLVDETTSILDPTCGSASSLRAAESLGATRVLGLELNPDHADAARGALRSFRTLRRVT